MRLNHIIYIPLIILIVLASGCSRQGRPVNIRPADEDDSRQATGKTGEPQQQLVFGEERKNTESSDSAKKEEEYIEIKSGDVNGQLFSVYTEPVRAEDTVIGQLADINESDPDRKKFAASVGKFFDYISEGEIHSELLHPDWRNSLMILLKDELPSSGFRERLGSISGSGERMSANVRLIGETGRATGEITADYYNGDWLISDISLTMKDLDKEYTPEEFSPVSYSNVLLNY